MATRIYTKSGDAGETGLFGGKRVRKDDRRVEAYGDVDELNAAIGNVRALKPDSDIDATLFRIQNDLFALGADLATPFESGGAHGSVIVKRMPPEPAVALEQEIDRLEAELTPLKRFVLPGGTQLAASLHLARTVCRRAERSTVALADFEETEPINPEIVRYLNRLSDLLFVMARAANRRGGVEDVFWEP